MKKEQFTQQIKSTKHISGHLHVTGTSKFIGEETRPSGMQSIKLVFSPYAHAEILSIDTSEAVKIEGMSAVITWKDIPGQNQINHIYHDEPLLPETKVTYVGQPVVVVVAQTEQIALYASKKVKIEYRELQPVLTVEEALEKNLVYIPERRIEHGNVDLEMKKAKNRLKGVARTSTQEQFYMETQRCWAIPSEDGEITLFSATQSTTEVQETAAMVLGKKSKDITVDVRRLGGAFGGKERAATIWACLAALAANHTHLPCELKLSRLEDMTSTGKRNPFKMQYEVGFDDEGRILAYDVVMDVNGGAYTDLTIAIMERGMLHADNTYYLPNARIAAHSCRTNLPPNTAFRGFGGPQGIFAIETVMNRIARYLKKDPLEIRKLNCYKEGQKTPYKQTVHEACSLELLKKLEETSKYNKLKEEVKLFNQNNANLKRGIGVVPVKFGISFTTAFLNQGSALVLVYTDGTISLSHGGIEMGQEINTKVAQVVSRVLGVSMERIRQESSNTKRTANASPTAASSGSDINGNAARVAAEKIRDRLANAAADYFNEKQKEKIKAEDLVFAFDKIYSEAKPEISATFEEIVGYAYVHCVDLCAHGYYATPGIYYDRDKGEGTPFYYFVYGCGLVVMEIDTFTGASRLVEVVIVHETGESLNPEVDKGQVLGAFYQGYGWSVMEEEPHDEKGRYLALTPSTYKFPCIRDYPEKLIIELVDRNRKHASVLGSKAVGEPPLIYGEAAYFAIQDAIESISNYEKEADLEFPATPEATLMAIERMKEK
ncbi:MAG TPA: xanthine dehydrogenase molybdopterin binding subunit [Candidatus Cloacimonadota bacterium]|nr:xanthine dehydrogenase molybdopterin binding subunit [Candidatus Cloacimonadota bacterium]